MAILVHEQDGLPHPRRKFDETVVLFCSLTMVNAIGGVVGSFQTATKKKKNLAKIENAIVKKMGRPNEGNILLPARNEASVAWLFHFNWVFFFCLPP